MDRTKIASLEGSIVVIATPSVISPHCFTETGTPFSERKIPFRTLVAMPAYNEEAYIAKTILRRAAAH